MTVLIQWKSVHWWKNVNLVLSWDGSVDWYAPSVPFPTISPRQRDAHFWPVIRLLQVVSNLDWQSIFAFRSKGLEIPEWRCTSVSKQIAICKSFSVMCLRATDGFHRRRCGLICFFLLIRQEQSQNIPHEKCLPNPIIDEDVFLSRFLIGRQLCRRFSISRAESLGTSDVSRSTSRWSSKRPKSWNSGEISRLLNRMTTRIVRWILFFVSRNPVRSTFAPHMDTIEATFSFPRLYLSKECFFFQTINLIDRSMGISLRGEKSVESSANENQRRRRRWISFVFFTGVMLYFIVQSNGLKNLERKNRERKNRENKSIENREMHHTHPHPREKSKSNELSTSFALTHTLISPPSPSLTVFKTDIFEICHFRRISLRDFSSVPSNRFVRSSIIRRRSTWTSTTNGRRIFPPSAFAMPADIASICSSIRFSISLERKSFRQPRPVDVDDDGEFTHSNPYHRRHQRESIVRSFDVRATRSALPMPFQRGRVFNERFPSFFGLCFTFNAQLRNSSNATVRPSHLNGGSGELLLELYVHRHQYLPFVADGSIFECSSAVILSASVD